MKKLFLSLAIFCLALPPKWVQAETRAQGEDGQDQQNPQGSNNMDSASDNSNSSGAMSMITSVLGVGFIVKGSAPTPPNYYLIALGGALLAQSMLLNKESDKSAGAARALGHDFSNLSPHLLDRLNNPRDWRSYRDALRAHRRNSEQALKDIRDKTGMDIDPEKNLLTTADGSFPLNSLNSSDKFSSQMKKMGVSDEDMQVALKEMDGVSDKIKKAMSGYRSVGGLPTKVAKGKKKRRTSSDDDFQNFLGQLFGNKKNKNLSNKVFRNVSGERIGVANADIFDIIHESYWRRSKNKEFLTRQKRP